MPALAANISRLPLAAPHSRKVWMSPKGSPLSGSRQCRRSDSRCKSRLTTVNSCPWNDTSRLSIGCTWTLQAASSIAPARASGIGIRLRGNRLAGLDGSMQRWSPGSGRRCKTNLRASGLKLELCTRAHRPMPYTPIVATLGYVLSPDRSKVLMIHRNARQDDQHLGKYNGLGGKMEPGEDIAECMRR